ncbi:hypothetical protein DVH24_011783 [Malus domestica]|uniref:Uncharacterized protein n=1 Tax=Malus domestica TaxID=3750 RepID=A0A498JUB6_MALDO|nr:hypothetical protein DVH24_011783 [Malus domestica]
MKWDKVFYPAFGAPKMGGTHCSMRRILDYNLSFLVSIGGHLCSLFVLSRPVLCHSIPFRSVCIPNDT